jgi:hypothetical protein
MSSSWVYVVTDIEVDGPHPGPNSMRSFASVAITADGVECGRFERVLEPLPGAAPNPDTYAWFQTEPEAWAACTMDPRPVGVVMGEFVAWLHGLPAPRVFAASPLGFDGTWMDYYLRRFTAYGLAQGPYEQDRVFHRPGLCIASCASGILGITPGEFDAQSLPAALLGDVPHTHRAIDDALGYAHLLVNLMAMSARTRGTASAPGSGAGVGAGLVDGVHPSQG